jgi:hypothetical protein
VTLPWGGPTRQTTRRAQRRRPGRVPHMGSPPLVAVQACGSPSFHDVTRQHLDSRSRRRHRCHTRRRGGRRDHGGGCREWRVIATAIKLWSRCQSRRRPCCRATWAGFGHLDSEGGPLGRRPGKPKRGLGLSDHRQAPPWLPSAELDGLSASADPHRRRRAGRPLGQRGSTVGASNLRPCALTSIPDRTLRQPGSSSPSPQLYRREPTRPRCDYRRAPLYLATVFR